MTAQRRLLVLARSVFSVLSVVTVVFAGFAATANAQPSRVPSGSDSIALAIVARAIKAGLMGPMPEYAHWIDEMQFGDALPIRMEVFMAKPDKIRVRGTILDQGSIEWGFDGTTGWTVAPGTGVTTLKGRELAGMRASVNNPLGVTPAAVDTLDARDVRLVYGGKVMFEGEFTDLVLVIDAKGDTTENYFAVSTGLLSADIMPRKAGQRGSTMTFYRDYKRFGGSMVPGIRTMILSTGTKWTTRLVYTSTDSIPDETFRRPARPGAP